MEKKLCAKCKTNPRFSKNNSYCRPCKSAMDLKSYHNNNESRKKYMRDYRKNNPGYVERVRLGVKEWRKKNPNYINEWTKNKYRNNEEFRIYKIIQSSLHNYLNNKEKHTLWYLGCTLDEFKNHLESQFVDGMCWENQGKFGWHIDHIKPANTFDFTNPDDILECWNYKNLRPLWWEDNLKRPKNGTDIRRDE